MDYKIHFAPLQGIYRCRVPGSPPPYIRWGGELLHPFVRVEKDGFRNKDIRDIAPDRNSETPVIPQLIAATPDEFRRLAALFREKGIPAGGYQYGLSFPYAGAFAPGAGILPLLKRRRLCYRRSGSSRR